MTKSDHILATLALQEPGTALSPVQVQKFFFILDEEVPSDLGGPYFNFEPYDYGPFDADVYSELNLLAQNGLITIINGNPRRYSLTEAGRLQGQELAQRISDTMKTYIKEIGDFVSRQSFQQLVSAIYKKYPEMKAKSVFRG